MVLLTTFLFVSCSGDADKEQKTGTIESKTKEIGQEAVKMIKTPMDKAQKVADQASKRAEDMDKRSND